MLRDELIQEFVKNGCTLVEEEGDFIVLDGTNKIGEVFLTLGRTDNPNDDIGLTIFGNGIIEFNEDSVIVNDVLFNDIGCIKYICIHTVEEM